VPHKNIDPWEISLDGDAISQNVSEMAFIGQNILSLLSVRRSRRFVSGSKQVDRLPSAQKQNESEPALVVRVFPGRRWIVEFTRWPNRFLPWIRPGNPGRYANERERL
jgi:hypothetical protein